MFDMRRRQFMGLFGGAVTWPLAARAQQSGKPPTVGFMGSTTPPVAAQWVASFVQVAMSRSSIVGQRGATLSRSAPICRANLASSYPTLELDEVQAASRTLGIKVIPFDIRRDQDIALAFEALKGHAEALYIVADPLVSTNRIRINTLALGVRLPTMPNVRELVEAGGLMPCLPCARTSRRAGALSGTQRGARRAFLRPFGSIPP
jgi:hypothetical protein